MLLMRLSIPKFLLVSLLLLPITCHAQGGANGTTSTAADNQFSNVRRDNLLNGLQIVSLPTKGEATVRCTIVIRAGSMFDSVGKTGLVALTQRTLLAVNPQLREELESLQTKIEWGVDADKTWFQLDSNPANFEAALEILSRLLVVENIRTDAFKRAQSEQLAMIKQGGSLSQRADESFLQALYGDYPYGRNVLGSELTVSNLRQGDIYDIFQRFYLANNASVILSGNVAPERTLRAFKYLFGGWSKGAPVPATFRQPVQIATPRTIKQNDPQSNDVEIRGGVAGVKYGTPEFLPVQLLAEVLKNRWARRSGNGSPQSNFIVQPRILPGPFYFSTRVSPAQADETSQRLTETFNSLVNTAISAEELTEARNQFWKDQNARSTEDWLLDIETFSLPRNYPLTIKQRIDATNPTDLQALARKLLELNALTLIVVGRVDGAVK